MSNARIYLVTDGNAKRRLVKANNQPQALRFVARRHFTVMAAKPIEVAEAMGDGVHVEDATKEAEEAAQ